MEKFETIFKSVFSVFGTICSYIFGGFDSLLIVLIALMVIDYVFGFLAAAKEGKLSSRKGTSGITRKIAVLLLVAVANFIDVALQTNHLTRNAAMFWFIANEILSIIENAGRMGIPVPPIFKRSIEILKKKSGEVENRENRS